MAMGPAVACGSSLNELCQITFTPLLKSDSYYCADPKGAGFAFLAFLQDAWHHAFFTGGAPVGDHRLISAILSG